MTLHILRDPAAYLCLDYSLACSNLESLLTRIRVALERRDRGQGFHLPRVHDPAKWKAFEEGTPQVPSERYGFTIDLRLTDQRVIVGKL